MIGGSESLWWYGPDSREETVDGGIRSLQVVTGLKGGKNIQLVEHAVPVPVAFGPSSRLSGEVLEVSPEAKDTPDAKGLKRVNPRHVLVWEIDLGPDEKKTLSYTYKVYVRN